MPSTEEASDPPPSRSEPKKKVRGVVIVTPKRCKGCGFCVEFCPTAALEMSDDMNEKGYHYPVVAHPEQCNGCDLCGMLCPDFAIFGFLDKRSKKR